MCQGAIGGPAGEVAVDGAPVGVAVGQGPPWAAGPQHVQDRVHQRTAAGSGAARPARARARGGQQRGKQTPLRVGQIGGEPTRTVGAGWAAGMSSPREADGAAGRSWGWHATTMPDLDDLAALLGAPATPAQRRRQQASQARFDHAVGLVEQAAKVADTGDQAALAAVVARMDQASFDDFEQHHPPSAALNFLLYDVVCDLAVVC